MIRQYTACDHSAVVDMMHMFYNSSAVLHSVPPQYWEETLIAVESSSPYVDIMIIQDNDEIAGYVQLSLTHSNEVGGMVVLVDELYVCPQHQGKGLGSSALQYVADKYSNAKRLRLEVCSSNSGAIALYTRMGFEPLDYCQYVLDM